MPLPTEPVTLSAPQIEELHKRFRTLRHDVNGSLAIIVASAELIKLKPERAEEMLRKILAQPAQITQLFADFSAELEKFLNITHP